MNDRELIGTSGTVWQALVDDVIAPQLLRYVHAVYDVSEHGLPDARGSCVLLRRGRDLYLATAAHVLEANESGNSLGTTTLYVGGLDKRLHELNATFRVCKEPLDLAVARLDGKLATAWDLYPALDLDSHIAVGETAGVHLLLGYPVRRRAFSLDRARDVVKHKAFKYTQVRSSHKKDTEYHFTMLMPRGKVKCGDNTQMARHPRGVSGGGVFHLRGPQPLLNSQRPEPMLAGILIRYERGERLVATKASQILHLL